MKKLQTIIVYTLTGVMLLIFLMLVGNRFKVPGGFKIFVVQSGSMSPKIPTGSAILDRKAKNYNIGDVITFGKESKTTSVVTHRIIEKRKSGQNYVYKTKGDFNNEADQAEVVDTQIIGKVVFHIPYLGYLLAWAKTKIGFVVLIVIPAIVLILEELKNMGEDFKKSEKEKDKEKDEVKEVQE